MNNILIKNGNVLLFSNIIELQKTDILIRNSKISKIESNITLPKEDISETYIIDATNKIVLPGLINTHTHLPMSIFRGTFENCNLMNWLNKKIWPIESHLTKKDIYYATLLSCIEQISTGTTCTNDHYFISESIRQAVEESKIRAVLTRVLMDIDNCGEQRLNEFKSFYSSRNINNELISYSVGPHALYTCTSKYLDQISNLALEYKLPVHIHFLESINEITDIKNLHGNTAINILNKYFANTYNILAHCVKLNSNDIELLKTMNCGISHNPISNLKLGCKIADITKYINSGLNVAIGTDGQGSGNNLDMFEALKFAFLLQGGIHEDEDRINSSIAIKMATLNGAKLLQLDNKIGSLEVGKQADIIIVNNIESLNNIAKLPKNNILSNLVNNTYGKDVDTTIVNGEILMENRNIKHIDVEKVIAECNLIVKRLNI